MSISNSRDSGLRPRFRLEDLFEKSDMKMENGNMGSESSKKLKCCRENICRKIEVSRARCPSKLCCSLAFITLWATFLSMQRYSLPFLPSETLSLPRRAGAHYPVPREQRDWNAVRNCIFLLRLEINKLHTLNEKLVIIAMQERWWNFTSG